MTGDLFGEPIATPGQREALGAQACVLRGFARSGAAVLVQALEAVLRQSPWRHMTTPGGFTMSAAQTNCGPLGWVSDRRGYRYAARDPLSGQPWPAIPPAFERLARDAAAAAGFAGFEPDACLVNRYVPGARLSLHQDKDEAAYEHPIVSVSLGIPAVFLWGGHERSDKAARVPLFHGDVVVWGGADRLRYHGVLPLKPEQHPLLGEQRINLTLRRAG